MVNEKTYREQAQVRFKKWEKYIFIFIICVWLLLIGFSTVSLIQPIWLQNISDPGRNAEAQSHVDFANKFLYSGEYEKAIVEYVIALKVDPGNLNATGNLGIAYMYLERYDEAQKCFDDFKKLEGAEYRMFMYYVNYADLYERLNDSENALKMYAKAVSIHPNPEYALRKAGYFALLTYADSLAFDYLSRSIFVATDFTALYKQALYYSYYDALSFDDTTNIRITLQKMEVIDYDELANKYDIETYKKTKRVSNGLGYSHYYLGLYYKRNGDLQSSDEQFNKAISCNPQLSSAIAEAKNKETPAFPN